MDNNVLLQDLRGMTVQIRHRESDAIVGTGVAISAEGRIITCAHVVRAAGVEPRDAPDAQIGVYFPQARGTETKARRAIVAACFPQYDDDIVLLQLVGGASPLAPEQIATLGRAEKSCGNEFRSYGYAPIGPYLARHANGKIMGAAEIVLPAGTVLHREPIQLETRDVRPGMSGAAVLDVARNLVVGLVTERWNPAGKSADDNLAWATDAAVLTFDPFNFALRDDDLPLRAASQPKTDVDAARAQVAPDVGIAWNNAPSPLKEWVGREELLAHLTADWRDPNRRVTGLIGFGGEGKSSLARKWVDGICRGGRPSAPTPDGVFWWGFYERPSVDEFFEAALKFMSGGKIDPRKVPSANVRAQIIGAMLGAGRYLFVLDGLEVMQYQEGDQYGLLRSGDLKEFIGYFAAGGHSSFLLITSRAPLLDLMGYTTYTQRDVERLSPADGRALLREIGVRGRDDAALDKVVVDWDGHALTLSLLAAYLVERHGGIVAHVGEIPIPTANEPRYERVHRVLRRYDEHLSNAERAFLTIFSAFRTPVNEAAFEKVFRARVGAQHAAPLQIVMDDAAFRAMVKRLVSYRILRRQKPVFSEKTGFPGDTYTTHPLIRAHYFARLTAGTREQTQATHERIKDYYLAIAGDTPHYPTLDDLKPLIEVVHHACRAGAYDEAWRVVWERIYQRNRYAIAAHLGAYETALTLMLEFFPKGDTSQEPQLSNPKAQRWILNTVGHHLTKLGRLSEAVPFYERAVAAYVAAEDWHNDSISYQNLASLYAHLGALEASADAAHNALTLARRAENKKPEMTALCRQATTNHLRGNLEAAASSIFQQAEQLEREIDPNEHFLYGLRGIQHTDHLRRIRKVDYALHIAEANLKSCEESHWPDDLSRSHRVLGDLDADAGQHDRARAHYDEALKIAHSISDRAVLIEALLARGRWAAKYLVGARSPRPETGQGDPAPTITDAFNDLNEALEYALAGGYRIYEADIRVALAWAHLALIPAPSPVGTADRGRELARVEAERALRMSEEMGYYWGKVDAEQVLEEINRQ